MMHEALPVQHGDNSGLALPPAVAPIQAVIIPVAQHKEGVLEKAGELYDRLKKAGLRIAGLSPDEKLVEIVELPDHPWFVGVQFHPEFKSRPNKPHKLFADFIRASLDRKGE